MPNTATRAFPLAARLRVHWLYLLLSTMFIVALLGIEFAGSPEAFLFTLVGMGLIDWSRVSGNTTEHEAPLTVLDVCTTRLFGIMLGLIVRYAL